MHWWDDFPAAITAVCIIMYHLVETIRRVIAFFEKEKPAGPAENANKGDRGEPGTNGTNGTNGEDGNRGRRGKKGKDGMDGEKGDQGPLGRCACCAARRYQFFFGRHCSRRPHRHRCDRQSGYACWPSRHRPAFSLSLYTQVMTLCKSPVSPWKYHWLSSLPGGANMSISRFAILAVDGVS